MVEVRLDGEKLLKHIETIEDTCMEIRSLIETEYPGPKSAQGIDLTKIEWKGKGSVPASAGDSWAWAFGYDQDGEYLPESRAIVMAIEAAGKVVIDGYEMTLSGRDKRLLSRNKVKSKGRGR